MTPSSSSEENCLWRVASSLRALIGRNIADFCAAEGVMDGFLLWIESSAVVAAVRMLVIYVEWMVFSFGLNPVLL